MTNSLFNALPDIPVEDIYFVCIGTDRSTGDSLGPLVGTKLTEIGFPNVIGTLEDTCNAVNLVEWVRSIPNDKVVIAVDSALGDQRSVGQVRVRNRPLTPGAGVGKNLGKVGDYGISGVVNVAGFMEYYVLQNTRLSIVMRMANEIVEGICEKYEKGEITK
jgi:putative sporulation protein YyaC